MTSEAGYFARLVVQELADNDARAANLEIRTRGKTATIGLTDSGQWVPLLRLSNPSAKYNVMNLDVRHHSRWSSTFVRGVPEDIAKELLGPLRFTWQLEFSASLDV